MKYSIMADPSEFSLRAIAWTQGCEGKATRKQAQEWSRKVLQDKTNIIMREYNIHLDKQYGRDSQPVIGEAKGIEYSDPPIQKPKKKRPKKPSPRKTSMNARRKAMARSVKRLREQEKANVIIMHPNISADQT